MTEVDRLPKIAHLLPLRYSGVVLYLPNPNALDQIVYSACGIEPGHDSNSLVISIVKYNNVALLKARHPGINCSVTAGTITDMRGEIGDGKSIVTNLEARIRIPIGEEGRVAIQRALPRVERWTIAHSRQH